jgi:hypothetical protein
MSASVTPCHTRGRQESPPFSPAPAGTALYYISRSPSPTPTSVSENHLPLHYIESRSPSPTLTSQGSSPTHEADDPPPYTSRIEAESTTSHVHRQKTYAVRVGREGEVYGDLHEARLRYRALLCEGKAVAMVVAPSLSQALAWINQGLDPDTVVHRQAVLNALAILCAEQSDTDMEFEGDSESSLLTEDLEEELNVCMARDDWCRLS